MKKIGPIIVLLLTGFALYAQVKLTAPGVKWEEHYQFDRNNVFKVEFYAAKGEMMRAMDYKTCFQSNGEDFSVILVNDGRGFRMETIFDKKNEVAIQIYGSPDSKDEPYYNAGRFKYPTGDELKKLDLVPTSETKAILGVTCKKYTYTYKKIFGEAWITDEINLPNDYGIFRAAKMSALHNTLSLGGFVMEMTTEDTKGGKTLMRTISLNNKEEHVANLKKVNMNTAINKVSYYTF